MRRNGSQSRNLGKYPNYAYTHGSYSRLHPGDWAGQPAEAINVVLLLPVMDKREQYGLRYEFLLQASRLFFENEHVFPQGRHAMTCTFELALV